MLKKIFYAIFIASILYNSSSAIDFAIYTNSLQDSLIESENSKKDILVIFTADWCGFCQKMKKDIDDDQSLVEDLIVCYIDYDENKDLVKEYKVKNIPDYFLLHKGVETKRKVGYSNKKDFKKWLKNDNKYRQ
jgi:thioredoxin 1